MLSVRGAVRKASMAPPLISATSHACSWLGSKLALVVSSSTTGWVVVPG